MRERQIIRHTYPFTNKDNVEAVYYCSEQALYHNTNWDNKSNIIQLVPDYVNKSKSKNKG